MYRGTIVDGPSRRPRVSEPRSTASAMPQSASGAIPPATYFQNDRVGNGGVVQESDVRRYQGCIRQEGIADAGTWFDMLHDVEATVLWPQIRERGSPSDVLGSQDRRYVL